MLLFFFCYSLCCNHFSHLDTNHLEVCRSTKYMMLHVRDCPGTTASFDVCPFPWCRKVKHLLYHLVSCAEPAMCSICSNVHLNRNMRQLKGLNNHRGEKFQVLLQAKNQAKAEVLKTQAAAKGNTEENLESKEGMAMKLDEPSSSFESAPFTDTALNAAVDYSIVPPLEHRSEPLNAFELSSSAVPQQSTRAIKVEEDGGTTADLGSDLLGSVTMSHGEDSNPFAASDATLMPGNTTSASLDSMDHPLLVDPAGAEDFNSVTPDSTKS